MGLFITVEGIEGSGKSTLITNLEQLINQTGHSTCITHEPGATDFGKKLRAILLESSQLRIDPLAELFLFQADRAQHIAEVIRPALEQGQVVLSDRFIHSTLAYQGYGRELPLELVSALNQLSSTEIKPSLTLLLDLDPAKGLERARARAETQSGSQSSQQDGLDRFEKETLSFHMRIREGFLAMAKAEPELFLILDAEQDRNKLATQAFERIQPLLSK